MEIDMTFTYDAWVSEQTEKVWSAVNRLAASGIFDAAVYCLPSNGSTQGELIVSTEPLALEVVRFELCGSRSAIRSAIWHSCRGLPICPW
jgi:hypothetical protein